MPEFPKQWIIQDSPVRGRQPKGGQTYYLANFFQKLNENEENLAGCGTSKILLQRELCSLFISVSLILLGLFGCVTCIEYNKSQSDLAAVPGDIPDRATQVLLRGNKIRTLQDGEFSDLTHCTYIDLGENSISVIQPGSFRGLPRLFTLELDINELTEVKKYMFQNLTQLTYLLLQSNLIKFIQDDSFKSLVNLEQLHLAWNVLDELRAAMFNGLRSIKLINLDGNKLTSIDSITFSDLPRPLELALDFNPLVCDGHLCWLKEEEQQGNITWLVWAEHLYQPSCSGDVTWDAWVCPEGGYNFNMVSVILFVVDTH